VGRQEGRQGREGVKSRRRRKNGSETEEQRKVGRDRREDWAEKGRKMGGKGGRREEEKRQEQQWDGGCGVGGDRVCDCNEQQPVGREGSLILPALTHTSISPHHPVSAQATRRRSTSRRTCTLLLANTACATTTSRTPCCQSPSRTRNASTGCHAARFPAMGGTTQARIFPSRSSSL